MDQATNRPSVSVILSVKNGGSFLTEAIESILTQTYTNLEFIIMNDGSDDETDALIRTYTDPRIVYLSHPTSLGLPTRLNEAIQRATGKYIARMDADDIALPTRLERQVEFFEAHPTIDLVGTWALFMDKDGSMTGEVYRTPVTHEEILFRACFANPFIHPSMMVRAALLKAHLYDETYPRSQDFKLWSRLLFVVGAKSANLPEPLLQYRRHATSLTKQKQPKEYLRSATLALQNSAHFYPPTPYENTIFIRAYSGEKLSLKDICLRIRLSFRIWNAFLIRYPQAKAVLRSAPWKDVRFFAKYWIKQLIRPKRNTPAMSSKG